MSDILGVTVHVKVKPGREDEFEAVSKDMVEAVRAKEPGNLFYGLFRTDQPGEYYFMERWENRAAMDAHMTADHVQAIAPKMSDCIDGEPAMSIYEEIEQNPQG